MFNFGDIILAEVQYTDSLETKKRPSLVLFSELGNVVVAGITSNQKMKGIHLSKEEGAIRESVIKLNYIFTINEKAVLKKLFSISEEKKEIFKQKLLKRLV